MVLNTLWTQIEVVELTNDGSGLGFGISGNKSTGVVVKAIVPGSIADKDGRIHTGDHLFQINHVYVRGMSSEQVAGILRQCSDKVQLVVARSIREPSTATNSTPSMSQRPSMTSETLIHSRNPSSAMILDHDRLITSSQRKILLRTERLLETNLNLEKILDNLLEQCQCEDGTELLDVTLEKGDDGLGITVAGYVSPDSTNNDAIAGIFIRDIAEGSVSARDGRLAIGDQIIEVNDQSLNGFSNVQALYLLQNTSSSVQLKVRRYTDGMKYERIKEMIALESLQQSEEKIEFQDQSNINEQIQQKWMKSLGNNYEILIVDVYKPDNGNLGMTLEGTIDIENGEEIGAHHYIRNLLPNGIIEKQGVLKPGDELLEINNQVLYGKNHIHVIELLKHIKHQIKFVCARRKGSQKANEMKVKLNSIRSRSISFGKTTEIVVKAKSMGTLDETNNSILRSTKTRSLEVISNIALWSTTILPIELHKTDSGLGFSVLDYQDPANPSYSPVIVIRALVPGGVAQLDGRLKPGDRLVAVNDIVLENMTLDDAIKILKSTSIGPVKLSISKPLPYPKFKNDSEDKMTTTDNEQESNKKSTNRRVSRISKSKTTAEMTNNHKRSASSHRHSINQRPMISSGITLSAPAILCRHEYIETLLNKEMSVTSSEARSLSANRLEKLPKRISTSKRTKFKSDKIRSINRNEHITYSAPDLTMRNAHVNLPEFIQFQSDHLVLTPKLISQPLRTSSTSKINRQSLRCQTPPPSSLSTAAAAAAAMTTTTTTNPSNSLSSKRSSRSRHSHDPAMRYDKQQPAKYSSRSTLSKFDPISCFQEPELSSDENIQLTRSSSLINQNLKSQSPLQSPIIFNQIKDFKQQEELLMNDTGSLVEMTKCSSSSKQSSRVPSPALSLSSHSSGRVQNSNNQEIIPISMYLERELLIKNNFDQLNLVVDASIDNGINGCCIRSITSSVIDNFLQVGDWIVSINNENMRKISNAQARSIIRRAALVGSDISIIFILAEEAKQYKEQTLDPTLIPIENLDSHFDISIRSPTHKDSTKMLDTENLCLTLWGPPRMVILNRDENAKNLGISIVGGKLDFSGPGNTVETCISGIFIKHVIPDSLAGRHSSLKTGDRILEVNEHNLRDATHDHAVEIIRSARSPIYFLVQSLLDPSSPNSHEKQYEHLDGDVLLIDIKRDPMEINEPLGLSLIGHRDPEKLAVFICDIQKNSLIGRDNRLQKGDQLLQINDEILLDKPHSVVTSIIKSIKSEILNFIILRNSNAIHNMALNNPYANNSSHVHEYKLTDNTVRFTSISQPFEEPFDDHSDFSNSIIPTNTIENNNKNNGIADKNHFTSISSEILLNQESNDLFPTSSDKNEQTNRLNKQQSDYNGSFVSHIPMMSSSSSNSSLHIIKEPSILQSAIKKLSLDDPRTRPIFSGQETLIEIDREKSGLGLSVVGGSDTQLSGIIIHDIYEGCAAQRDGRLLVGDQILEVNSIDLRSATHEQAIRALRQSPNIIRLLILRREIINEEDKFDIITVEFIKKAGKGLGFSIIGRRQGPGTFISHIIEGGLAEKDGRLMSGDLILEVNGKDLRTATYEQVAYTLKTLPHARVSIKIGRLKVNASQTKSKSRSRSSSTNKINDR